ncbi:MAG: phospholipase D-like domain-containing protein [Flavobacteriales bacterium]
MMDRGFSKHNRAEVVLTGPAYFTKLEALINDARQVLHVQVYILQDDKVGARIWQALVAAAHRKVLVFVMADGFASQGLPKEWIEELRAAGGQFRWFEPLFRSHRFYIGRRMHHKMAVADHRYALVSGRNIAERYTDVDGEPGWYDLALSMEGEVAVELAKLCCRVWNGARSGGRARALPPLNTEHEALVKAWPADMHCSLRVRFNDWLEGRGQVTASYLQLLNEAKKEVWLVSSYFLPGTRLKRAIGEAARRGVRVRIIAAGPSDVALAKPAERWLYAWLLRIGVEVYEYQRTILHGKAGVRDGVWATIGSFNLNDLSTYTTLEVNVDVDDTRIGEVMQAEFQRMAAEDCKRVTRNMEERVPWWEKLWWWTAFRLLRLMHVLLTAYYRQRP